MLVNILGILLIRGTKEITFLEFLFYNMSSMLIFIKNYYII